MDRVNCRNELIDLGKVIASFLVVCIHSTFFGKDAVQPILRMAVPFFFVISGYFYQMSGPSDSRCKKQMIRMVVIYAVSSILYLLMDFLFLGWSDIIGDTLSWLFSKRVVESVLLLNYSPFWESLWFLPAMIYVWGIEWILYKLKLSNTYIWIPLLIIGNLLLGKYYFIFFSEKLNLLFSRNFLFTGLPLFEIGRLLYELEKSNCIEKISKRVYFVIFSVLIVGNYIEKAFLDYKTEDLGGDMYFFTVLLVFIAVCMLIRFSDSNIPHIIGEVLEFIGDRGPLYIYIFHGVVSCILGALGNRVFALECLNSYFQPIICYLLTFFAVGGINTIKRKKAL